MNLFETAKQNISTRQAAEHYGIKVNRSGMACCPFHPDKTPSMKVDQRYYCFGCGETGDVIDFVSSLFGLGKKDAAEKLILDYGILYDNQQFQKNGKKRKQTKQAERGSPKYTELEERLEEMVEHSFGVLCDYMLWLRSWKEEYAPKPDDENWHPLFVEALAMITYINYQLDILQYGLFEEKAMWMIGHGKKVNELEQRISKIKVGDTRRTASNDGCNGISSNSSRDS